MASHIKRRVRKDGKVSYQVSFPSLNDRGEPCTEYKTFALRKKADAHLRKLKDARDDDGGVISPSNQQLDDYLDDWLLAIRTTVRANSLESYKALLERHVKPKIGAVRLKALKTDTIQTKVYDVMTDSGLSPRTIRYVHSVLHSALDHAVARKKLRHNPSNGVKLPKKEKRQKIQPFSLDEARGFLQVVSGDPFEALFHLLLTTGLRPSEAFALKWSDLDLDGALVVVRASLTRTKGGVWRISGTKTANCDRSITLPSETVDRLRAHRVRQLERRMKLGASWPNDFVFTNGLGEPVERHNLVRRHFKPALVALGKKLHPAADEEHVEPEIAVERKRLMSVRLYDLRHSMATLALASGVNVKVVSERLGHGSIELTLTTYAHVLPGMQEAATDTISDALYGAEK